ncbi:polysaccharide deacetylase family protein [Streptomyces sp. NPDC048664]|uniref:polysaccharide deacetylase family protein n=1 Tax=Streptomyces sp. NPDC048664 TaxID=3154505 RepID=UPI003433342E
MGRVTTPLPPPSPDPRRAPAPPVPDRRSALRTGARLAAAGALATACAPGAPAAPAGHATRSPHTERPAPAAPTARAFPGAPGQIDHGPRDRPRVALTFHGQGDPAYARSILGTAERAGAKITVLAVGTWLDQYPDVARRVLDGGHDLGNHTQHHVAINAMAEKDARAEIQTCADRLRRLTGSAGTWFRPSRAPRATPLVERLAREAGYPHVLSYDVDSLDYTSPGAPAVTRKVIAEARGGSVVSLHFGYADTVTAFPALLHELARRGLAAVTTTELLS